MSYKEISDIEKRSDPDKTARVPSSAVEKRAKKSLLNITALIRSIQRTEGNPDCFRRGCESCDQLDCAWRLYCLNSEQASDKEDN